MADTIVVFYFVNAVVKCAAHFQVIVTGHHQRLRLCWFSLQVCGLPLSCRHHVKELCCVPQGGLALSILPFGGTALVLLRWPSSREAVKLTKLRNVLSG